MVQRTLMLAAQVLTARDLILADTLEDYRVAYLLLDSAAELLMVRRVESELSLYYPADDRPWLGEQIAIDLNDPTQREREKERSSSKHGFVNWTLSNSQRRSIQREFLTKVRYLAWSGSIAPELVAVLGRLHDYRNEIYHNDRVRHATLSATVKLYVLALGALLRKLRPSMIGMMSDDSERIKSIFMRANRPVPEGWLDNPLAMVNASSGLFELQEMFAEEIEAAAAGDLSALVADLATDVERRLHRLHSNLDFASQEVARFGPHPIEVGDEELTQLDVVRYIYWQPVAGATLHDLRRTSLRFNRSHFASWAAVPGKLRAERNPLQAFTVLVEFESEFEDFEERVAELAGDIDGAINFAIDWARGK